MDGLFDNLPSGEAKAARPLGGARLRTPVRDQIELRACDLDSLIGDDDRARLIWAYASRVDLRALEAEVKAREGAPGMPQTSLHLLLALWLLATARGVGSARGLARLCESDASFRWLCGGVGVNHRLLSDFRFNQGALIERLLAEHVASLSIAGLIDLGEIAQDGVRVRAGAGAASFRRRKTLEGELAKAKDLVARLAKEGDDDPGASDKRGKANRERAAREREARVEAALAALGEARKLREKRSKTNKAETERQKEPRASTTDAQARVMKMPDGGFRPAYNIQFASVPENGVIVAVGCGTVGSDRGLAEPMARAIEQTHGARPKVHLVDGGYMSGADIEAASAAGTAIYCPPGKAKSGRDPLGPRTADSPALAAWRARMASDEGKERYKRRSRCELVHAKLRNLGLDRVSARGKEKVLTWMRWFALASNIAAEARLRAA